MRTGVSVLPLHGGKAPRWLFSRMVKLAGSIAEAIVIEYGTEEFLRRIADPFWFQSLGCLLGFDWHSSGLTTTTTGAIKEGIRKKSYELGLFVAGGKGKVARKTPDEIFVVAEKTGLDGDALIYASRASAKTDSALLQDGYSIYHHAFFFDNKGNWAVIQQGMNERKKMARRYHWVSDKVKVFHEEPHAGIKAERKEYNVLDLTSKKSRDNKRGIIKLLKNENPDKIVKLYTRVKGLVFPNRHPLLPYKDINPENLYRILKKTYDLAKIDDFTDFYMAKGVGATTLRALSLLSDVIFGARPSYEDPALYSYAHGGKDGYPYPVSRRDYDKSIEVLERAIKMAKLGRREELKALERLSNLFNKRRSFSNDI